MKFVLSYILIYFILILTFYIIYFTNKSTNKENFVAVDKLTIKEYVPSDIIKEKLFLMTDTDGNLSTVNKLNERLDIIKNNIEANTAAIAPNTNKIADTTALINANTEKIAAIAPNTNKITENQNAIGRSKNGPIPATGLNADMDTANESLAKLLPLVDGKLCGSKDFENTRGSECKAIRYNDFMTIQNYGAKRKDNRPGWYLRVTGEKFPEFIRPDFLDSAGDKDNRGIKTIWSIIPQATKTTTTTQRQPYENPIWAKK